MQRVGNVVQIGIAEEAGAPDYASEEIEAIEVVMGGVEEGLDQVVAAARKTCPNSNCCLSAVVTQDEAEGGSWDSHPHNNTTYTVPFTRIEVSCSKNADGCNERANRLADGVTSMVKACVDATGEADTAGKKKTAAAAQKAKGATSTAAVKKAKETVKTAETKAKKIKSDGQKEAEKAQKAVYTRTRKEVVASVSKAAV